MSHSGALHGHRRGSLGGPCARQVVHEGPAEWPAYPHARPRDDLHAVSLTLSGTDIRKAQLLIYVSIQ